MTKPNILFLCTGNSARSQMAEAFARRYAGEHFDVFSAGIEPKGINPFTIQVMNEIGYNLDGHTSKGTKEFMGRMMFRYLVTVCDEADRECPRALWANHGTKLHWSFEDPAAFEGADEEKLAKFREVRDQIERQVREWVTSELKIALPA